MPSLKVALVSSVLALAITNLVIADENLEVRRILQRSRQILKTLPEDWSQDPAKLRAMHETSDKFRSLQDIVNAQAVLGDLEEALATTEGQRIHGSAPFPVPKSYEPLKITPLLKFALGRAEVGDRAAAAAATLRAERLIDDEAIRPEERIYYLTDLAIAQAQAGDRAAASATSRRVLKFAENAPPPRNEELGGPLLLDSVSALRLAARALEAAGEKQAAEDARSRERKIIAAIEDVETRASLLWGMALERRDAGDMPGAMKIAREVLDLADPSKKPPEDLLVTTLPLAVEFIVIDQAKTDWDEAMRTLDRFGGQPLWHQTLRALAAAPGRAGDWGTSLKRYDRLLPSVQASWSHPDKALFLTDFAAVQVEVGDRTSALATARRVLSLLEAAVNPVGFQQVAWLIQVARIQSKAGDRRAAFETLRRTRAFVETIKDDVERFTALADVAGAFADLGDGDGAMRLLAAIPSQYVAAKNKAAKAIALARGKAGELSGARRALDALIEDRKDPRAALVIAEEVAEQVALERAKAGDVPWALEWAEGQTIPLAKVRALIGTAHGLMQRPGAEGRKPAAP